MSVFFCARFLSRFGVLGVLGVLGVFGVTAILGGGQKGFFRYTFAGGVWPLLGFWVFQLKPL